MNPLKLAKLSAEVWAVCTVILLLKNCLGY